MSWPEIPWDISEGMVKLLELATVHHPRSARAAITTVPDLWLYNGSKEPLMVLNVSSLVGSTRIVSHQEIVRDVVMKLQGEGWPTESIVANYRPSSRIPAIIDIALVTSTKTPLAVVEVTGTTQNKEAISQVKGYALIAGVRFGLVTDGKRILLLDSASGTIEERAVFPGPHQFGYSAPVASNTQVLSEQQTSVASCSKVGDLIDLLVKNRISSAIVDHTIPYIVKQLNPEILPQPLRQNPNVELSAALLATLSTLPSVHTLVGVVPRGVCFRPDHAKVREFLQKRMSLYALLELPSDLLRPFASLSLTMVALSSDRPRAPAVLAARSSRGELMEVDSQPWFNDFKEGLEGRTPKSAVLATIEGNQPWVLREYSAETKSKREQLENLGGSIVLGDLFEVNQGYRHSRIEATAPKGNPVIRGRDIPRNPTSPADLARFSVQGKIPVNCIVKPADVLIQGVGLEPSLMVAGPGLDGVVASDTVFLLRPKDDRLPSRLLCEFLQSSIGQWFLTSIIRGEFAPTLLAPALRSMPVPLLPREVQSRH